MTVVIMSAVILSAVIMPVVIMTIVIMSVVARGRKPGDEEPHAFVDLRRRQSNSLVLLHRLEHVVDELLDLRRADLGRMERAGLRAEDGMPHARDFQNRHTRIICATIGVPMTDTYRYCPTCGGALETRLLKAGDPQRLVCTKCGFILYLDPKVAVGTIITPGLSRASAEGGESRGLSRASAEGGESRGLSRASAEGGESRGRDGDNRIVLVRRAIEPGYGLWVFPGGYVDRGEEVTAAARREAREEAGLDVRLDGLVNIYSYPEPAPHHHCVQRHLDWRRALHGRGEPRGQAVSPRGDSLARAGIPQHPRCAARLPRRPGSPHPLVADFGGSSRN